MSSFKKKRTSTSGMLPVEKKPPEGTLDRFFGWLNENYTLTLPRLKQCPKKSLVRDLLTRKITYSTPSGNVLYEAIIEGKFTLYETIILNGLAVQIKKTGNPKGRSVPLITFQQRRSRRKTT